MKLIPVIAIAALTLQAGDFLEEFQVASEARRKRDHAAATIAFAKLAETVKGDLKTNGALKAKCLAYATAELTAMKKYDDALALTDDIADPAWKTYARMVVLAANPKTRSSVVEEFNDVDFETWPEEIAYKGYLLRGKAKGMKAEATPDLEKAIAGAGRDAVAKLEACRALAAVAKSLGDREKTLAALDQAIIAGEMGKMRGNHLYLTPALERAKEAIADGDFDKARAVLDAMLQPSGNWGCRIQEAYGDLYVAMAKTSYRRALAQKNAHETLLKSVREKLSNIEGNATKTKNDQ